MKYLSKKLDKDGYNRRFLLNTENKRIRILDISNGFGIIPIAEINYLTFTDEETITESIQKELKSIEETEIDDLYSDLTEKIRNEETLEETLKKENDSDLTEDINKFLEHIDVNDVLKDFHSNTKTDIDLAEEFLIDNYKDDIYRIIETANVNKEYYQLIVDYEELIQKDMDLAEKFNKNPTDIIRTFNTAVKNIRTDDKKDNIKIKVAFDNIENEIKFEEINASLIGKPIKLKGRIKQIYDKRPLLNIATFECSRCKTQQRIKQNIIEYPFLIKPNVCNATDCKSKKFDYIEKDSEFTDVQTIIIEEDYSEAKDITPKHIEVYLQDIALTDSKIGSEVEVAGILSTTSTEKSGILKNYIIKGNLIKDLDNKTDIILTNEEIKEFEEFSKKDNCLKILTNSVAPNILLDKEIKEIGLVALANSINVLCIGEVSTGKTDLKKFLMEVAPKYVSVYGSTSSTVGLTASSIQDKKTNNWILQAGAILLAGDGTVFVDELDKFDKDELSKLNEPLYEKHITISKAGFTGTVSAPANVIAFANPKDMVFDEYKSLKTQITFNFDTLSIFPLKFLLKNEKNMDKDLKKARLISSRRLEDNDKENNKISGFNETVDKEFNKKYLIYIKRKYDSKLFLENESVADYSDNWFANLKNNYNTDDDIIPIDERYYNFTLDISEAIAKLRLHKKITLDDYKEATRLIEYSLKTFGMEANGDINIDMVNGLTKNKVEKQQDQLLKLIKTESINILDESIPTKKIEKIFIEDTGVSESTFYNRLNELEKKKYIKHTNKNIVLLNK